jgi:hypothetical protein
VTRDALALTWAMVFPSVMTWIYFVAAAGEGTQANVGVMAAYGPGKVIQFAFPAVYVLLTDPRSLRQLLPNPRGLVFGLAFGLVVGAAALALYHGLLKDTQLLRDTPGKILAKLRESGFDSVAGYVTVACFYSTVHAFLEEYYWRWFVFGWCRRHVRLWLAVVLASAGFMAHHVIVLAVYFPGAWQFATVVIPLSLAVAVGGAVWCGVYQRTGSLTATWVSHLLVDAAVMLIGWDMLADRLG